MKFDRFVEKRQYLVDRAVKISYEIIRLKEVIQKTKHLQLEYDILNVPSHELALIVKNLESKIKKLEKYNFKYICPLFYTIPKIPKEKNKRILFGEYNEDTYIEIEGTLNNGPSYFSKYELDKGYVLLTELTFDEEGFLKETKDMCLDLHTGVYLEEDAVNKEKGKVIVKKTKELLYEVKEIDLFT